MFRLEKKITMEREIEKMSFFKTNENKQIKIVLTNLKKQKFLINEPIFQKIFKNASFLFTKRTI